MVLVIQMLPPHKTVQILFLAPSPQRAAVEAITVEKMEEPEALEVVVEGHLQPVEAEGLETPHPQAHHKVTMAEMQSVIQAAHLEPVVGVVVHLP